MNSENSKPDITAAVAKWLILGAAGIGFISAALVCYFHGYYTWVLAAAFAGCFLVITAWKKLRLLKAALRAVREGRAEITIFYRDGNLRETEQTVVPVEADGLFFYGFSRERNDTCMFRWNRIRRVSDKGKDLTKDELLSRAESR
jgi:energy-converting hydrogenase Eha subunit G